MCGGVRPKGECRFAATGGCRYIPTNILYSSVIDDHVKKVMRSPQQHLFFSPSDGVHMFIAQPVGREVIRELHVLRMLYTTPNTRLQQTPRGRHTSDPQGGVSEYRSAVSEPSQWPLLFSVGVLTTLEVLAVFPYSS